MRGPRIELWGVSVKISIHSLIVFLLFAFLGRADSEFGVTFSKFRPQNDNNNINNNNDNEI